MDGDPFFYLMSHDTERIVREPYTCTPYILILYHQVFFS